MKMSAGLEKFVDFIGEVLAFLTVALIVFMYINRYANFLPENVATLLATIREIAILVVVGLAGLEFALKRGFVVFLIYAALVATAIVFMCIHGVLPVAPANVSLLNA